MHHLVAWYESIDPAGAFVPITGVPDPSITVNGDNVRVLPGMPNVIGLGGLINDASGVRAQLQSPSLRASVNQDIEPVGLAAVWGNPPEVNMFPESPRPVMEDEDLNFYVESNPASAVAHYGLAWMSDGPIAPVNGPIITVRATTAITLAAGVWVNGALTFSQVLPVGRYQITGMRARSANMVAARLVFVGQAQRPGVPAVNALGDRDLSIFRKGGLGVWGEFHTNTPPTIDALGITDTAQVFEFDLVRV